MRRSVLILIMLLTFCFGMAAYLQPKQVAWEEGSRSGSLLKILLGDGRRIFANHFFAKADAYFHKGKYPSVFDQKTGGEDLHIAEQGHDDHEQEHEHDHHEGQSTSGEKSLDWIERFGHQFTPSQHVHLGGGEEREILPWLRISAELDPQKVETYVVAAYWLRTKLGKPDEAEQFLREGLKANPDSPEILFELGRVRFENHHDLERARNLWTAALRAWRKKEGDKAESDRLLFSEIVGGLARLEQDAGNINKAVEYLESLKEVSPNPSSIDQMILKLRRQENP